jgi:putative glycerol-1-phosphate prenyltransferase
LSTTETYNLIQSRKGQIAVLIDPDKSNKPEQINSLIEKAEFAEVDFFFVGGSTVTRNQFEFVVSYLKENSNIPIVLFPGASHQISKEADALLYLSLISGRNPDFLIGHHVQSADEVYDMEIEVIPTAYILIDGGTKSSVAYVSQTTPIPSDKLSIILNTAKAGILQGKKIIYVDAGSGALNHVPDNVIQELNQLKQPIIVGGGIRSISEIESLKESGANVIVIGNKIEEDIDFLLDIKLVTNKKWKS